MSDTFPLLHFQPVISFPISQWLLLPVQSKLAFAICQQIIYRLACLKVIGNVRSLHFDPNLVNYCFIPPTLNKDIPSNSSSLLKNDAITGMNDNNIIIREVDQ